MFGEFYTGYSEGRRAAERRHFKAECRVRNLTAQLDSTPSEDFDGLFDKIEQAREEEYRAWCELLTWQLGGR